MARHSGTVTNTATAGSPYPIIGALIAVESSSGTTPTLYADDGVTVLDNPLTSDAYGTYYYNAPADYYDHSYSYGGRLVFKEVGIAVGVAAIPAGSIVDALGAGTGVAASQRAVTDALNANQVAPEFYGAIGNGTTNDAAALQAALNTGKNVVLTAGKTYKFTSGLSMHSDEQRLGGPGILAPNGSFDAVTVGGGLIGCELDLTFNAPSHTGTVVKINNASRVRIRKLLGIDVASVLSIQKANTVTVDWLWAQARGKGITWFGNAANRSDILRIGFAVIGFADGSTQYGFDWDGNCNSFSCGYLGLVNGYGAIIRNTSGDSPPAIGRFNHIEIDYSDSHGIDIQAGSDFDFNLTYALGAAGSGMRVASTINADEVRIGGGKFRGNARYGIEDLSAGQVFISGNVDLLANTLGATYGPLSTESPRFQTDATNYWTKVSGNVLFAWDINDYQIYDTTNNRLTEYINSNPVRDSTELRTKFYAAIVASALAASTTYANDAAAAAGGVAVGQLYRNGSVVQIRVS